MGRPRKPTALKILEGAQPCRINGDEPRSAPGLGDPPGWLDDLGREAWATLRDRMGEMGVATRADEEAAALYCSSYSRWRQANAALAREGLTIVETLTTKRGTFESTKPHPMLGVANEAHRQMARLLAQFGMNPAARSALHVSQARPVNPLVEFMASKPKAGPDGKRGKA